MTSEVVLEGTQYVLSREAASLTGYAQDYIGQLARKGLIDARRIGGLWYVSIDSIKQYKVKSESEKTDAARFNTDNLKTKNSEQEPDSLVFLDGQELISASRASRLTGYTQDYVGQLARSGKILSRQVGNRWYIERTGLLRHKKEKDALLAAVQADSVGIVRPSGVSEEQKFEKGEDGHSQTYFVYNPENKELIPPLEVKSKNADVEERDTEPDSRSFREEGATRSIPIRVLQPRFAGIKPSLESRREGVLDSREAVSRVEIKHKTMRNIVFSGLIIGCIGLIFVSSLYITANTHISPAASPAFQDLGEKIVRGLSFENTPSLGALEAVGDMLERWLAPEIVYKRAQDWNSDI